MTQVLCVLATLICSLTISIVNVFAFPMDCTSGAKKECYFSFKPAGQTANMFYYSSVDSKDKKKSLLITNALVVVHGHSRDANKTFDAGVAASKAQGASEHTLIVAPLYQVTSDQAKNCMTKDVPKASPTDLTWTCESWIQGGSSNGSEKISSYAAMDAFIAHLKKEFPNLNTITIAGFSAGAQMVQHYIGFASDASKLGLQVRYVVSDPGIWLYFDSQRAQPYLNGMKVSWDLCRGGSQGLGQCELKMEESSLSCPELNDWKYGLNQLPHDLPWGRDEARKQYAQANVFYMEGALDSSSASGTFYPILDKSCAANAQGPYRLQRGVVYAFYDRTLLAPEKHRTVTIVPNCSHNVSCVFPSKEGREVLLPK